MSNVYNKMNGKPIEHATQYINMQKMKLDASLPPMEDIRKGADFKAAQTEASRAQRLQNEFTLGMLHNTITQVEAAMSTGRTEDKAFAINLVKANIPKVLQSIATGQSDAIQMHEAVNLLPEFSYLQQIPLKDWSAFVDARGGWAKAIKQDPDLAAFVKKAKSIYASGAGVVNQNYYQYQNQLGRAVDETGLRLLKPEVTPSRPHPVLDIQRKLQGLGIKVDLNPFESNIPKPVGGYGQSQTPTNVPVLPMGKIKTSGSRLNSGASRTNLELNYGD